MITAIGTGYSNTNYRPNFGSSDRENFENFVNEKMVQPMQKSGKVMHAISSFLIPGTGQILQDRKDTGLNHLMLKTGLMLFTALARLNKYLLGVGILGELALNVYSAFDAYNNAPKKTIDIKETDTSDKSVSDNDKEPEIATNKIDTEV